LNALLAQVNANAASLATLQITAQQMQYAMVSRQSQCTNPPRQHRMDGSNGLFSGNNGNAYGQGNGNGGGNGQGNNGNGNGNGGSNNGGSGSGSGRQTVVFERVHAMPPAIVNDPNPSAYSAGAGGKAIVYDSATGVFTIQRKGVYAFDASVRANLRGNGDGVELRWLVPAAFDADPTHPFGVTDSDRAGATTTQSVPAFSSVTVSVTTVPAVFSFVGEAPRSFVDFGDGWARVTLVSLL